MTVVSRATDVTSGERRPAERARNDRRRGRGKRIAIAVVVFAIAAIYLFPLLWVGLMSIKPPSDIITRDPVLAFPPTAEHFQVSFTDPAFAAALGNSLVITGVSVGAAMVVGCLAGYALARFQFRGANAIAVGLIVGRMIPPIVYVVPIFVVFRSMDLLDTRVGLIVLYAAFNIPLVVWLMRGFFLDVPVELEEAALTDGASRLRALWSVTMPLAAPGIAATAVLAAIFTWGEYLFALILTSNEARTLPIYLSGFQLERGVAWGPMTAAAMLIVVPLVVVGVGAQRHIVKGLTFGAVKG